MKISVYLSIISKKEDSSLNISREIDMCDYCRFIVIFIHNKQLSFKFYAIVNIRVNHFNQENMM